MQRGLCRHVHFLSTVLLIFWGLPGLVGCDGEQLSNSAVCGDGVIQANEECDDGSSNGETATCTPNCLHNSCGDGLVFNGVELCDNGALNSDDTPDSCRSDCSAPHCGDNVTDTGEECDDGEANSDTEPDACRVTCVSHGCGDGVVDAIEQCDNGPANSNDLVDGCRTNCQNAWCGDGIKDSSEDCDDGSANSNIAPDACREDCGSPGCGDGVIDIDEACDNGENNSDLEPDACRTDCSLPLCNATELPFSTHADSEAISGHRGDSIAVTCDSGYSGGGSWVCGEDGNFTGAPCVGLPCTSTRTDNSEGHLGADSITGKTGDSVLVVCAGGYEGGGMWTCQPNGDNNGVFTGEECTPISCVSGDVPNSTGHDAAGSLKGATGDAVTVTCEAGYDGGGEWTCGANGGEPGVFTGPSCFPLACDSTETPNTVAHSSERSITGATGQTVIVECTDGFSGGGTWTCGANHTLTGPPCTPEGCIPTETPYSDKKTKDSIFGSVNGSVLVTCDEGYLGGGSWTCVANADGEGVFGGPKCIPEPCDPADTPNTVAHSEPDSITGDTGETVNVVCADGFVGGGPWTCNPDGTLTGPGCRVPACNGAQTPDSDHSANGSITGLVGGTVEVSCDAGYIGGGAWTCNADLTFTGPACDLDTCDNHSSNDCAQDCTGTLGGPALVDHCGTCDTDSSNDCVQDCADVWGGTAVMDTCDVCVGGDTGETACLDPADSPVFCELTGSAGDVVSCPLNLVRSSEQGAVANGLQFDLVTTPGDASLTALSCPVQGFDMCSFKVLRSGHTIATSEVDVPEEATRVMFFKASEMTNINDAFRDVEGTIVGEPHVADLKFTLSVNAGAEAPLLVELVRIVAADANADGLPAEVEGDTVVTN